MLHNIAYSSIIIILCILLVNCIHLTIAVGLIKPPVPDSISLVFNKGDQVTPVSPMDANHWYHYSEI